MIKEFKQMNKGTVKVKPVLGPIDYDTLSPKEPKEALGLVNLIKEKEISKSKAECVPIVVSTRDI